MYIERSKKEKNLYHTFTKYSFNAELVLVGIMECGENKDRGLILMVVIQDIILHLMLLILFKKIRGR